MKIGIIGAMDVEIAKFKEILNLEEKDSILYTKIKDKEIYISLSGIGKVNSAANTQKLIDKYNLDYIINTGCAGSLNKSVKVLDVVLSSSVTYHDFTPTRIRNSQVPDLGYPKADDLLLKLASQELDKLDINYHIGVIASGDCFVTDSVMRDKIFEQDHALAVDMESGSIGHIARLNNVPYLSVRTISDFADGIEELEEKAGHISAEIVKYIIENL